MINLLVLMGLVLVGVVVLAGILLAGWLILRPASSPKTTETTETTETTPTTEATKTEDEAPAAGQAGQFEVRELEAGPHPRPRELDRESRRELMLLDDRLHRAFFEQSGLSPDQWARIADDLLIIHDDMPVGILVERFEQATDTEVSAPSQTDMPPLEIASMLNEQLSDERRLELLGTLEEPVEADVYGPAG